MDASPSIRWVGSRVALCGACPAFTRVPACMVADRPHCPFGPGAPDHVVASMIRPDCHQPKRQTLGGVRTRRENASFQGARILSGYRYLTHCDGCRIQGLRTDSLSRCAVDASTLILSCRGLRTWDESALPDASCAVICVYGAAAIPAPLRIKVFHAKCRTWDDPLRDFLADIGRIFFGGKSAKFLFTCR